MIPVLHCSSAIAKALGAIANRWPNNPPQLGIYIEAHDGRVFFWPADAIIRAEMRA